MRFTTALIASAFAVLTAAQSVANPFTNSDFSAISAGQAVTITWSPTTTGPVSLVLVKGDATALTTVSIIASASAPHPSSPFPYNVDLGGLKNSGSFDWTPDSSLDKGSDYALKIVDDADDTAVNYTLQFAIDSAGTASSVVSSAAASSAVDSSAVDSSIVASTTANDASTEGNTAASTAPDTTTTAPEASPTNDNTTLATVTTADASSSAFSAPDRSATAEPPATSSEASKTSSVTESSSTGAAAATGATNVRSRLMGIVGAAVLLL